MKIENASFYIKILLMLGLPFVLALPIPPPPFHIDKFKAELQKGEHTPQEKFSFLTDNKALGASLFSKVLGIETKPMPGYICITNTSEIFAEGKKIDKVDLLEQVEAGAMSIGLNLDDKLTQLYIPFASTTCSSPQTVKGSAELDSQIEVRGFLLPLGKPELVVVNDEFVIAMKQYADLTVVFSMEGEKGYYWRWDVFRGNYFLFLIGWIILWASILQVWEWARGRKN